MPLNREIRAPSLNKFNEVAKKTGEKSRTGVGRGGGEKEYDCTRIKRL